VWCLLPLKSLQRSGTGGYEEFRGCWGPNSDALGDDSAGPVEWAFASRVRVRSMDSSSTAAAVKQPVRRVRNRCRGRRQPAGYQRESAAPAPDSVPHEVVHSGVVRTVSVRSALDRWDQCCPVRFDSARSSPTSHWSAWRWDPLPERRESARGQWWRRGCSRELATCTHP